MPEPPTSLLVEYMSLGSVFRYNHTVDTFNHTFLALRTLMTPPSEKADVKGKTSTTVNYKYVEFRDARDDWNCSSPPLEREFYDLDLDPFEIRNLISEVSPVFLQSLHSKMQRMFHCQGDSCRREQMTGLKWSNAARRESIEVPV